jgi:hypothetical protein
MMKPQRAFQIADLIHSLSFHVTFILGQRSLLFTFFGDIYLMQFADENLLDYSVQFLYKKWQHIRKDKKWRITENTVSRKQVHFA